MTRWSGAEFQRVFGPAVDAVRRRQWHRFWLGPAASLIVIVLGFAYRTSAGHAFIEAYAITRPGQGWSAVAPRLPLSMFAPAALLPFWFAIVQVGVVYGVAQAVLGRRRTVAVAVAGHVLATYSAHLWILVGRPLGVSHRYDSFGDAGPSVAVVALIAYLGLVRGAGWLVGVLVTYDVTEIALFNGLSQREHLVGVVVGAGCGAVERLAARMRSGPSGPALTGPALTGPALTGPTLLGPASITEERLPERGETTTALP